MRHPNGTRVKVVGYNGVVDSTKSVVFGMTGVVDDDQSINDTFTRVVLDEQIDGMPSMLFMNDELEVI